MTTQTTQTAPQAVSVKKAAEGHDILLLGASAGGVHALTEIVSGPRRRHGRPGRDQAARRPGFTCPDCGGALWESGALPGGHFRCRTGHAYSPESLLAKQAESLDAKLWAALRALEEGAALARRMEALLHAGGRLSDEKGFAERALRAERYATGRRPAALVCGHQR
jgi:two-component system, chemotaxis family, protein-glutamate methylesterase/glutaminase